MACGLWVLVAGCGAGDPLQSEGSGSAILLTPCEALSRSLRAAYAKAQRCESDTDCIYVDGFYDLIPRAATDRFVTTSDCREKAPFLVTANPARLVPALPQLLVEREIQRAACAEEPGPSCEEPGGFLSSVPPTCADHACVSHVADPG